jgi:hypothetical protein
MGQIVISRTAKAIANEPLARAEGAATRSLESEITPFDAAPVRIASAPPPKPRVRARKPIPEGEAAVPQRPRRAAPQPAYPAPDQGGARYLAPVAPVQAPSAAPPASSIPAPSSPRIPAPQAHPMGPQVRVIPMRQTLDPTLPMAAYRGPSSQ